MSFSLEEERLSDSPLVAKVWRVQCDKSGRFTSTASINSEIVIAHYEGKTQVTVRGPETKATPAFVSGPGEFLGIEFKLGTYMPTLLPSKLINRRDADLPVKSERVFWLDNSAWEIPNYENADSFVTRLVQKSLLVRDPLVEDVLQAYPQKLSARTVQYRFRRATGLTQKRIQQINRAKQAARLLQQGLSILDTAQQAGYYDQAHMTNSLKRFIGQTPAQIAQTLLHA